MKNGHFFVLIYTVYLESVTNCKDRNVLVTSAIYMHFTN
jgi:hypothetical protein